MAKYGKIWKNILFLKLSEHLDIVKMMADQDFFTHGQDVVVEILTFCFACNYSWLDIAFFHFLRKQKSTYLPKIS